MTASMTANGISTAATVSAWAAFVIVYWAPSIILLSRRRRPPSVGPVVVINGLLGWTVVGWVLALVLSLRRSHAPR